MDLRRAQTQGLFGRLAGLSESPSFATGIGFLPGLPQGGIWPKIYVYLSVGFLIVLFAVLYKIGAENNK